MESILKKLFMYAVLCAVSIAAVAQSVGGGIVTVKGTVLDEKSQPVAGVAVLVNNNPKLGGTATDEKGEFHLSAPIGSTLWLSSIGYETQEVSVTGPGVLLITMVEDVTELTESVVVGFGVQTKESIVGSISKVTSDDLVTSGSNSAVASLKGKVAGLLINSPSGLPNSEGTTRLTLRGVSHWTGATSQASVNDANDNAPLVMVDGVERSMTELDPNEIESISVLKDASATAVFGSKGANGVILITTKVGAIGKPKMRAKVEYGVRSPLTVPDHVDAETTLNAANIAYRNGGQFAAQYSKEIIEKYRTQSDPFRYPDVNWFDEIFKDFTPTYNANFDISGGTDKLKYFASGSYIHDSTPIKIYSNFDQKSWTSDRFNYRLNLDMKLTPTTKLAFKFGGAITINNDPDAEEGTLFMTAYMASGLMFPAYFTDEALKQYPDPNFPDASGIRLARKVGTGSAGNPMTYIIIVKIFD